MTTKVELCANCARPSEGNYSVHRDGLGKGPEVPLCDWCGGFAALMLRKAAERREQQDQEQENFNRVRCSSDLDSVRCSGSNRHGEQCRRHTTDPIGLCRYHGRSSE